VVGDRLYKAGDWGYMLSDGSFEICGRCDSMVKIRGYSIEIQVAQLYKIYEKIYSLIHSLKVQEF